MAWLEITIDTVSEKINTGTNRASATIAVIILVFITIAPLYTPP